MLAKTLCTYSGEFFTSGKSLRDHGITESGIVSCVNTDADDMCVSAVSAVNRGTPHGERGSAGLERGTARGERGTARQDASAAQRARTLARHSAPGR